MKKNVCIVMLALYSVIATLLNLNIKTPGSPSSGLPEDNYRFWMKRSQEFAEAAEAAENLPYVPEPFRTSNPEKDREASKWAMLVANQYRDQFNRELSVRLWRDLAILGSTPGADKIYMAEYNARKL